MDWMWDFKERRVENGEGFLARMELPLTELEKAACT